MSAEHDSRPEPMGGPSASERARDGRSTDGEGVGGVEQPPDGGSKTIRTATADRGGPPLADPSETHRAVAARDRLWESYRGSDADGRFVWTKPTGTDRGK